MGYPRSIRPKNICIQWPFCLQKHKEFRQGATSQLMMLCNRTAVHDQLLQHGFHTTWHGGIRVSTVSSAAGATARVAVVVQTGCGFLSGGRKNATLDDKIFRTIHIFHVSCTSLMLSRHQRPDVPGWNQLQVVTQRSIATEFGMPVIVTPLRLFQSCFIAPVVFS